jgi:hypothetical protein
MKIFNFNNFEDIIEGIEGEIRPREYIVYMPQFLREMHPDQFYTGVYGETRLSNLPYVTARFYPEKPLEALQVDNSKVIVLSTDEKPMKIIYEGENDV